MPEPSQESRILDDLGAGEPGAAADLLPLVYDELRKLAAGYLQNERPNHTLQPTALVHEAFLRMNNQSQVDWKNKAHFFAVAATMIRRVLVDHARARGVRNRADQERRLQVAAGPDGESAGAVDLLALNEALDELERLNDRHRHVVELRYFGGLTLEETAEVLGVSLATVKADWRTTRAWLRLRLGGSP